MQVIIMRGIPGSGKSTWAEKESDQCVRPVTFSADRFFTVGGSCRFDPTKLGEAHGNCLRGFSSHLRDGGYSTIFVDNTNTTAVEIAPYYALALAYGAEVKIVRAATPFEVAVTRNTHNVPISTIWKMQQNLLSERLPPHWTEEFIFPEKS